MNKREVSNKRYRGMSRLGPALVGAAATLTMAFSGGAQAGTVHAYAYIEFSSFQFIVTHEDGVAITPRVLNADPTDPDRDITITSFLETHTSEATFKGVDDGVDAQSNDFQAPAVDGDDGGAPREACVGTTCVGGQNNVFSPRGSIATGNLARADGQHSGLGALNGVAGDEVADDDAMAEAICQDTCGGPAGTTEANTTLQNITSGMIFTVLSDITVELHISASAERYAECDAAAFNCSASGATSFTAILNDAALQPLDAATAALLAGAGNGSLTGPTVETTSGESNEHTASGDLVLGCTAFFMGGGPAGCTFNAGDQVEFGATINSEVQVNAAVPEPAPLALLGIGLLGLAFSRRRWAV